MDSSQAAVYLLTRALMRSRGHRYTLYMLYICPHTVCTCEPCRQIRGVAYGLLASGRVPSDHPEQPDAVTGAQVHFIYTINIHIHTQYILV